MMFQDPQAIWHWRDEVDRGDRRPRGGVGSLGVVGFDVEASDGYLGTVDESSGVLGTECIVIDAESWITGRKILVPAGTVCDVDHAGRVLRLDRTRAEVENSPGFHPDTFARPHYRDRVAYHFARTYDA